MHLGNIFYTPLYGARTSVASYLNHYRYCSPKMITMSITTNKLTRIGIMAAIVVTGAVACHSNDYKAQEEAPGADSGSRRVSTATTLPDSTPVGMGASVTPGAATAHGAPTTPGASTTPAAPTTLSSATTVAKTRTAHGRASITLPKVYGKAETAPQFPGGQP